MKEISLTQGKVALVDDADHGWLSAQKWHAARRGRIFYAMRNEVIRGKRTKVLMHRLITGFALTDHVDCDGLNNQRSNLRAATHSQNHHNVDMISSNSSGVKGIHWDACRCRWVAKIKVMGRTLHVGRFLDLDDAAIALRARRLEIFGEFARG